MKRGETTEGEGDDVSGDEDDGLNGNEETTRAAIAARQRRAQGRTLGTPAAAAQQRHIAARVPLEPNQRPNQSAAQPAVRAFRSAKTEWSTAAAATRQTTTKQATNSGCW